MHIVFATIEFVTEKAGDGGLANYLAKASQIFAAHGHKVTIVVLSEGNDSFEYKKNTEVVRVLKDESELSLLFRFIDDMEIKRNLSHCWYSYKLNKKIKEINKYNKIDIVQYCHLSALGLFRVKRIPSVVRMSAFDPIDRETHKSVFDLRHCRAKIDLSDKIDFYALKRADGVFAPSTFTAVALKKVIGKEITVLETPTMGIDLKQQIGCLPDCLNGKKYFLFFGTLNNKKGLKVIVQSIYEILKTNPQYYFVLVGKDCGVSMQEGMRTPVVKKMREEAGEFQDRIIYFSAMTDRNLLNVIIYHAELCILPFRFENLPNTCVEAMELGRIVISTCKSGISQMIKDGYNGFLVEQNNPNALVEKIRQVLALPEEEKKRISQNAMKRTRKMSPDRFYEYMMKYYQEIISAKNNVPSSGKEKRCKSTAKDKYFLYYDVLNKWMKLKENGGSVAEVLFQRGIHEIAIYGMADMGQHLQRELAGTDIVIKYAIDRSFFAVSDLDVYLPDSELPQVDAVIVTPVFDCESIRNYLRKKLSCPILSIAELFDKDGELVCEN